MTVTQLHLLLNHLPLFGLPIAAAFLLYGRMYRQEGVQRFALTMLFALAALSIPIYFTGEATEASSRNAAGLSEAMLATHVSTAPFALTLTLLTGIFAAVALNLRENRGYRNFEAATLVSACLAALVLMFVATQGSKIRRPELRGPLRLSNDAGLTSAPVRAPSAATRAAKNTERGDFDDEPAMPVRPKKRASAPERKSRTAEAQPTKKKTLSRGDDDFN